MEYITFQKQHCEEVLKFWSHIPGIHLHDNGEDSVEGIQAYLNRNEGFSFIAKDEGKIVGAIMCGHDGRRGLIHHLAVDTNYRRQGIGTRLLTMALNQLKEAGITKCALFVLKDNQAGEAFYQSQGWKEEDIVKIYACIL